MTEPIPKPRDERAFNRYRKQLDSLLDQPGVSTLPISCRAMYKDRGASMRYGHLLSFPKTLSGGLEPIGLSPRQYVGVHSCMTFLLNYPKVLQIETAEVVSRLIPEIPPFGPVCWMGFVRYYPAKDYTTRTGKINVSDRIYLSPLLWNPTTTLFNNTLQIIGVLHPYILRRKKREYSCTMLTLPALNRFDVPTTRTNPLDHLSIR